MENETETDLEKSKLVTRCQRLEELLEKCFECVTDEDLIYEVLSFKMTSNDVFYRKLRSDHWIEALEFAKEAEEESFFEPIDVAIEKAHAIREGKEFKKTDVIKF